MSKICNFIVISSDPKMSLALAGTTTQLFPQASIFARFVDLPHRSLGRTVRASRSGVCVCVCVCRVVQRNPFSESERLLACWPNPYTPQSLARWPVLFALSDWCVRVKSPGQPRGQPALLLARWVQVDAADILSTPDKSLCDEPVMGAYNASNQTATHHPCPSPRAAPARRSATPLAHPGTAGLPHGP